MYIIYNLNDITTALNALKNAQSMYIIYNLNDITTV